MKRIVLLSVTFVFVALSLSSCVKNRVCECKSLLDPTENYNTSYPMSSKKQAKADCENLQTAGRVSTIDYTCTLQ
jgi:hypothetical protein